ncbi:MAG: hypothetical protein AVDCRST_MAG17-168 [uncultured Solirubrobacterales bacterium]|uniref:Uncharacterized protein n=1 Tax=uncultured Solirubrobacterales bacterium TaxID=768556 RepID=A0A6J4RX81_9ACTN|nr:MAG: hypothetical protein AVDCRST_MAG17-168 [uncultured Solirubrobacterales bacterium]
MIHASSVTKLRRYQAVPTNTTSDAINHAQSRRIHARTRPRRELPVAFVTESGDPEGLDGIRGRPAAVGDGKARRHEVARPTERGDPLGAVLGDEADGRAGDSNQHAERRVGPCRAT